MWRWEWGAEGYSHADRKELEACPGSESELQLLGPLAMPKLIPGRVGNAVSAQLPAPIQLIFDKFKESMKIDRFLKESHTCSDHRATLVLRRLAAGYDDK